MKAETLGVALALWCALPAAAHDYWLEPASFFPAPGDAVAVRLHVGDDFKSEAERPFQKKPTVKFQLLFAKDALDLAAAAEDGKTPVAKVTPKAAGNYLIAMERAPQTITLAADKFNQYLADEGLDAVRAQRKQAGEDKKDGRERYSRYLKALLQAGDARDGTCQNVLGQRLEIVPQANPYAKKAGDELAVLVLFEGKPLAGAKLFAHHRVGDEVTTQTAVTSDKGAAVVKLAKPGHYLLRLVHMRRCQDCADADWESFWAACTFAVK